MRVAAGNGDVVVIDKVTGTVKLPDAVPLALSVTWTVNVASTAVAGGVPFNTPAALIVSQAGSPVADHV